MADIETLKKEIHDLGELVKKNHSEDTLKIETIVKNILAQHPGFTPETRVILPSSTADWSKEKRVEMIMKKMPKELCQQSDDILLLSKIMRKKPNELKAWADFTENLGDFKKALDTAATGGGTEWVPTDFSSELYEMVRLELKVATLFPRFNMPSNPYTSPIQIGGITVYRQAENTADSSQTAATVGDGSSITSSTTWTATKLAGRVIISKELEEDSIIPMIPFLKQQMAIDLAGGIEDNMVNGDTGTHEDTDITGTDRRTCWKGFRALSNENSYTTDLNDFNFDNIVGMRGSMGKYGVNPSELAIVCGIKGYIKLLKLSEVVTVDKYGANATVLSGELMKLGGVPVIVSEKVREVLDANAIYSASGSKTVIHYVYRRGFALGERRPMKSLLLSELYAEYDQDELIVNSRQDFQPVFPIASNKLVWTGRNIS